MVNWNTETLHTDDTTLQTVYTEIHNTVQNKLFRQTQYKYEVTTLNNHTKHVLILKPIIHNNTFSGFRYHSDFG